MITDHLLVWQLRQGSQKALEQIYLKYRDDLLTLAVNFLGNPAAAEDVVQDVFVNLVGSARTVRVHKSLKGFLLTSTANRARDTLRKGKRQQVVSTDDIDQVDIHPGPVHLAQSNDLICTLQAALSQLPVEQREIVVLRMNGHMTFRGIAEYLGISIKTAQSRYRYGLDKLRHLMNGELSK
jgi:RNA polymerase sigma factor (sigma-70 family)